MKYLIVLLSVPILLVSNIVGCIFAVIAVGFMNGYVNIVELLDKVDKK